MFAVSARHTNKGIAPILAKRAAEQKALERIDREAKAKRDIEAQKTEDKRQHDEAKRIKAELIAKQKHLQIIACFREVHIEGISRPRVKDIIDFVALGTNYSFEDIISPQLKREIVELRHYAMFRTPNASDNRDRGSWNNPSVQRRVAIGKQIGLTMIAQGHSGTEQNTSPDPTEKPGALNPAFVCWLMGFPQEWEGCAPTEMPSSRKSRQK